MSHPNGALVPEDTPDVVAAWEDHLAAVEMVEKTEWEEGKNGRSLGLDLLLGGGGRSARCDAAFCQMCTELGICGMICRPVCLRKGF